MTPDNHAPNTNPNPTGGPTRLSDERHLIAATPHLLGFFPTESLVMHVLDGTQITVTVRITLPTPRGYRQMARHAAEIALSRDATGAVVLIVSHSRHPTLARDIAAEFAAADHPVKTYGISAITDGAEWFAYDTSHEHGVIPDPSALPIAADGVLRGLVTYPSREDLAATLAPDPDPALARRTALIETLRPTLTADHETTDSRFEHLRHEVERTPHRSTALTDHTIATLALALEDPAVRDRCLSFTGDSRAAAAELLWVHLVRGCPAPQRAEAAVLLAMSAYIRGDGALAIIALDRALETLPDHRLAGLVRSAVNGGIRPDELTDIVHISREWTS